MLNSIPRHILELSSCQMHFVHYTLIALVKDIKENKYVFQPILAYTPFDKTIIGLNK